MFDQLSVSSGLSKLLNVSLFLWTFLSWVSTCVAFGGILFTVQIGYPDDPKAYDFYWNRVNCPSDSAFGNRAYSSSDYSGYAGSDGFWAGVGDKCEHSGQFYVAANIFAFLALLLLQLPASFCRIASIRAPIVGENARKSLSIEFLTTCWTAFWFFLSICVFGAQCFGDFLTHNSAQQGANNGGQPIIAPETKFSNVTGAGFGYAIFCFLMQIFSIVQLVIIRNNANYHLGPVEDYTQKIGGNYETASENYVGGDNAGPTSAGYQSDQMDATNSL